jgi:hypothetical protein
LARPSRQTVARKGETSGSTMGMGVVEHMSGKKKPFV